MSSAIESESRKFGEKDICYATYSYPGFNNSVVVESAKSLAEIVMDKILDVAVESTYPAFWRLSADLLNTPGCDPIVVRRLELTRLQLMADITTRFDLVEIVSNAFQPSTLKLGGEVIAS